MTLNKTMKELYDSTCSEIVALITRRYSTSFSMGIRAFAPSVRNPIYAIYGYVRFADEIVDTFHGYPKAELLARFRDDTWKAVEDGISLNPVLHAFQDVVRTFHIDKEVIDAFLDSMAMDLEVDRHGRSSYDQYIFGSAEVVGLMCLRVFVNGNDELYHRLASCARHLGAAFQKVNFLRDMKDDYETRGRIYFPNMDLRSFGTMEKAAIEKEIASDFACALEGIRQLPDASRHGVYLAYRFYLKLFRKICHTQPHQLMMARIRVPNWRKLTLVMDAWFRSKLRLAI